MNFESKVYFLTLLLIVSSVMMKNTHFLMRTILSRSLISSQPFRPSGNHMMKAVSFGELVFSLLPSKVSCASNDESNGPKDGKIQDDAFDFEKLIASQFDETGSLNGVKKFIESGLPGQVGYGFVMGYSSGFCLKKISRFAAFVVGSSFILIQSLQYSGLIRVDYDGIQKKVERVLDVNNDGKVDLDDLKHAQQKVLAVLQYHMPAGGGFAAGLIAGFRA